jgi:hypothetical protein
MDTGEVFALAEDFSRAVIAHDKDLINSYLCEELEATLEGQLDGLSRLDKAEVEFVGPLSNKRTRRPAEEFDSITSFWGPHESVVLRTVWTQDPHQLLIRTLQIVERTPAVTSETPHLSAA